MKPFTHSSTREAAHQVAPGPRDQFCKTPAFITLILLCLHAVIGSVSAVPSSQTYCVSLLISASEVSSDVGCKLDGAISSWSLQEWEASLGARIGGGNTSVSISRSGDAFPSMIVKGS